MKYALLLNDMRQPNIENIQVVKVADTKQELVDWYNAQLAGEPWHDGRWHKSFKSGSELEWYNPHGNLDIENDYWGGTWQVNDRVAVGMGLSKAA
jgi:hypothetical protein